MTWTFTARCIAAPLRCDKLHMALHLVHTCVVKHATVLTTMPRDCCLQTYMHTMTTPFLYGDLDKTDLQHQGGDEGRPGASTALCTADGSSTGISGNTALWTVQAAEFAGPAINQSVNVTFVAMRFTEEFMPAINRKSLGLAGCGCCKSHTALYTLPTLCSRALISTVLQQDVLLQHSCICPSGCCLALRCRGAVC
jgi:hypothetical protein